jgi:hypothetical protein
LLVTGLHDEQKADLNGSQPKQTIDPGCSIQGITGLHDRIEDQAEDGKTAIRSLIASRSFAT